MSSRRGRKRNDNLPPNRARDVQRAFRARRAAHLQALENRVTELEEENDQLRYALNLPPANRPPLGKGPTGKDKPKPFEPLPRVSPMTSSRGSSLFADSPTPPRNESDSPQDGSGLVPVSMSPSRPMTVLEEWDENLFTNHQHQHLQTHSPVVNGSTYHSNSLPAPISMKASQPSYSSYDHPIPSSSRPNDIYAENHHDYNSSRGLSSSYTPGFTVRHDDHREDMSRSPFAFNNLDTSHNTMHHTFHPPPNSFSTSHAQATSRQIHHPQPTPPNAPPQTNHHAEQYDDRASPLPVPYTTRRMSVPTNAYTRETYGSLPDPSSLGLHRAHLPGYNAMRASPLSNRGAFTSNGHYPIP